MQTVRSDARPLRRRRRRRWRAGLPVTALVVLVVGVVGCTPAAPDASREGRGGRESSSAAPGGRIPAAGWVVTLGDSFISGEGARWAGNTTRSASSVDALGPRAYLPEPRSERGCDRARQSIATVDVAGLRGQNLACSGGQSRSRSGSGSFVPGVDFFDRPSHDSGSGQVGQALALTRFARHHRVEDVVVSVGGNDFGFGQVVGTCVGDFVSTVSGRPTYCRDDPGLQSLVTARHVWSVGREVGGALRRVSTALHRAGERTARYRIIVMNYPSPIAPGARLRYPQTREARFDRGGCPLFDADATWANRVVLPAINRAVAEGVRVSGLPNVTLLDMSNVFHGHRLCERGVEELPQTGLRSWRSPGARQQLEWVNKFYVSFIGWKGQESFHPNYWGMTAERACVRRAILGPPRPQARCR